MFRRACLALALLAGVFVTVLSPAPAHAMTNSWGGSSGLGGMQVRLVAGVTITRAGEIQGGQDFRIDEVTSPSRTPTPTPDPTLAQDPIDVPPPGRDENPPAAPNLGPPTELSPQSALPETGGPSWVFAALGISLMLAGTVLTVTARRAGRRRG